MPLGWFALAPLRSLIKPLRFNASYTFTPIISHIQKYSNTRQDKDKFIDTQYSGFIGEFD